MVVDSDDDEFHNKTMLRKRILDFNWRLALARILVNAAALGLTFLILPNLSVVHPNKALVMLLGGLIFGLLNAFIRPILQFVMFNFLFATFGLVLVVINSILLLILNLLLKGWFEATHWYVWFIAGLFVGLFGVIFENLLGLTPPIVVHGQVDTPITFSQRIEERFSQERAAEGVESTPDVGEPKS